MNCVIYFTNAIFRNLPMIKILELKVELAAAKCFTAAEPDAEPQASSLLDGISRVFRI